MNIELIDRSKATSRLRSIFVLSVPLKKKLQKVSQKPYSVNGTAFYPDLAARGWTNLANRLETNNLVDYEATYRVLGIISLIAI